MRAVTRAVWVVLVVAVAGPARANPIPCEEFTAERSGSDVVLTVEFDPQCYDQPPEFDDYQASRDLFPREVTFSTNLDDQYLVQATDVGVSDNRHFYRVEFGDGMVMETTLSGHGCAQLEEVEHGSESSDLNLDLDSTCFASPLPEIEYRVERNGDPITLDWSYTVDGIWIRATATDDSLVAPNNTYEVGVKIGDETAHSDGTVWSPERPDAGPWIPPDANTSPDAGAPADGGGGGCAVSHRSPGSGALVLLLAVAWLWRRRR